MPTSIHFLSIINKPYSRGKKAGSYEFWEKGYFTFFGTAPNNGAEIISQALLGYII
jgi:hypothetical protein